jgi:tRNA A37 threonylcarbamoyladenosine dehydratase
MGAGGKSDMTRLHISDLQTAAKDPLASKLRQTMKKNMKKIRAAEEAKADNSGGTGEKSNEKDYDDSYLEDMDQLTIIYSSEKTVAKLADFTDEQKAERDKSQFGAVDGMRIRVLPVLGPLPAIMGQVRFR